MNTLLNGAALVHIVTLRCKDAARAQQCLEALAQYGKPDALAFHCAAYDFGLKVGTTDTVCLIERWHRWQDLDALLNEKVIPALPIYNMLLEHPFDPARDTVRIHLSNG